MKAYTSFNTRVTPQTEPIPGKTMIPNNAGGYGFALTPIKQLERFLILGSEGGSYYVGEHKLTKDNALNVIKAVEEDGIKAVDLIVRVSDEGRAVNNDPAIFALALAAAAKDPQTRKYALANLSKVCRIPTHLFHFLTFVKQFRGFGRGLKTAVGDWYQNQDVSRLAYQMVKYQSRDGWSNADALRLSHPKTNDPVRNFLYRWAVDGSEEAKRLAPDYGIDVPSVLAGFELAKTADLKDLVNLIRDFNLSREMLPTEALTKPEVWEVLLERMPLTAMIRNLGNMGKVGLLKSFSDASKAVISKLEDREALKKARVHPITILIALKTYAQGHGMKGSGQWDVVSSVVDALDAAFYNAFDYVEPTGKSILIGVDVSGSMTGQIANVPMSASEGAAAMALACAKVERDYEVVCFNTQVKVSLKIAKSAGLKDVTGQIRAHTGGGTDCSAPILWATKNRLKADAILLLTDNETWAGRYGHPSQVMTDYRNKVSQNAKIINLGFVATNISVNDPDDALALDVAGFDASVPTIINEFLRW